ncbi:MAG: ATP-binding protein [Bacteroidales bacterium]|nr:ATP-binding protein [Bacteroidales bacterium]
MAKKIAILGPECTGKTTLANQLAEYFNGIWVPEYARTYVANLNARYTFADVEHIAKTQIEQISSANNLQNFVFFDTELILTKVWFEVVFKKEPPWLDEAIQHNSFDLYLLTDTSIPWQPDPVRENGGQMREFLFQKYEYYLRYYKFPYEIVNGIGEQRLHNAIQIIKRYFRLT